MRTSALCSVVLMIVSGCGSGSGDGSLSAEDKQRICTGAITGAQNHCMNLGIPEDQCKEIGSEAFRVCFESAGG